VSGVFAVAVLPRQAPALFVIGFNIFGDGLGVCEFLAFSKIEELSLKAGS
jgi:hypothetical protein